MDLMTNPEVGAMQVRPVCLDAGDAVELGELLGFLGAWLAGDDVRLGASLGRFVGAGYGIDELRADVSRFAFLLGGDGAELFIGGDER